MSTLDLRRALASLAPRRPIFHSEADFQHALAWDLASAGHAGDLRLERPLDVAGERLYVDIVARAGAARLAIELKDWTRRCEVDLGGEVFRLKSGAAQDIRRFDFWKDVERVQSLVAAHAVDAGFVVALTNDPGYWNAGRPGTIDQAFRMADGARVHGDLAWDPRASAGTRKDRDRSIAVRTPVSVRWSDYSLVGTERFRYVVVSTSE